MRNTIVPFLAMTFIAFFSISSHASLAISELAQPTISCNGQISITADGTAGPFEIQIFSNGNLTHSFLQVDGNIIVDDLCTQDYQVSAINRFGCSHFLGDVLFDPSSDTEVPFGLDQEVRTQSMQDLQVSVYPNPFSDGFEILFEGFQNGRVSITGYDNLGRVIFETRNAYVRGENRFRIRPEIKAFSYM